MATRKNVKKSGSQTKKPVMKSGLVETPMNQPLRVVRYKARGRYKIVDGNTQLMIEPSSAEVRSEDQILDANKRARLLDLTRNLVRNSSLFNTILGSLTTRVVSTCGGKVILSLPSEEANKSIRKAFYSYTRNVDFYTGESLNHLLKRVLREYVIGGDCVLLFDDGLVEDSGKVLFFESNEIVNVPPHVVEQHYRGNDYHEPEDDRQHDPLFELEDEADLDDKGDQEKCRAGDSERRPVERLDGCDFDAVGKKVVSQQLVELVDSKAGVFLILKNIVVTLVKRLADFAVFGIVHGPQLACDGDVLIELRVIDLLLFGAQIREIQQEKNIVFVFHVLAEKLQVFIIELKAVIVDQNVRLDGLAEVRWLDVFVVNVLA